MSEDTKGIKRSGKSKYTNKMEKWIKEQKVKQCSTKKMTTRTPEKKVESSYSGREAVLALCVAPPCYPCTWQWYISWTRWTLSLTWNKSISIYLNTLINFVFMLLKKKEFGLAYLLSTILSSSVPNDHLNLSHHMAFRVCRPFTVHIFMFFWTATHPNYSWCPLDALFRISPVTMLYV